MKVLIGWVVFILIWGIISYFDIINQYVLPSPLSVFITFTEVVITKDYWDNIFFSLKINFWGYLISILLALPFGFAIGLFSSLRRMFSPIIDSFRFIPITALTGIFIALFGLTIYTKINFLAFGIWVYLVPVVVQRIDEVSKVHIQMMKTLGATKWHNFIYLYFPYVMSRLSDDIRILVGISWTYIIVAELKNIQGGLGSMIFMGEKSGVSSEVYCAIITIIIMGVIQDYILKYIDRKIFKFKL